MVHMTISVHFHVVEVVLRLLCFVVKHCWLERGCRLMFLIEWWWLIFWIWYLNRERYLFESVFWWVEWHWFAWFIFNVVLSGGKTDSWVNFTVPFKWYNNRESHFFFIFCQLLFIEDRFAFADYIQKIFDVDLSQLVHWYFLELTFFQFAKWDHADLWDYVSNLTCGVVLHFIDYFVKFAVW